MTMTEINDNTRVIEEEIRILTSKLTAFNSPIGDWKVSKCQEYMLCGLPSPYDIQQLHQERQAIRDRINELQALLV